MELNINKSTWVSVTLGEVAFEVSDRIDAPAESEYDRFVGLEHFVSGEVKIQQWESTRSLVSAAKAFRKGDVLFARRNAYLRRASLVDFDGCCSGDAYVLRENHDLIVPGLLPFIVNSNSLWDFANSNAAGTMSKRVKWKDLANYEFLLPPKDQQAEIAELLWGLQNVIETVREIKVGAEQLVRKLGFDCFYGPGCERVRLAEITSKIQDGSHFSPKVIYENNDGTRFRYVTSKNIRRNRMEFETDQFVDKEFHDGIFPRCDVKEGDALLTKDGANTGMATINHLSNPFSLLSSVCLLRSNSRTSNKYLVHFFNSEIGRFELMRQMTGTAITRLTLVTLGNFRIPLPPIEEQVRFVRSVDEQNQLIELCGSRIKSSTDLLRSTLSILFS